MDQHHALLDAGAHDREVETYELTVRGEVLNLRSSKYLDNAEGRSIDWLHEEAMERERTHRQRSQPGVRGLLVPLIDVSKMWLVVVLTGIGIGVAGAWLDILVKW
jgi:chloride channel 3/4/5